MLFYLSKTFFILSIGVLKLYTFLEQQIRNWFLLGKILHHRACDIVIY